MIYRVVTGPASGASEGKPYSVISQNFKKSSASLKRQSSEVRAGYNISKGSSKSPKPGARRGAFARLLSFLTMWHAALARLSSVFSLEK